ncbi:cysteinyl-tRNA synthetase [Microbotryum lychnidis-dioicae p1A1 Lamole]|uniref:cysteine--tRNA ligase n=1 Tax=Microbotryum lychnidis-dioicae (strain p1A1 Lamole / MvSl-1064) TaxID=683840 RepID=U5HAE4_USTV1|nr:cysteinyl-tRNA synthetase [Microbotryum lychnidis-dioicae p1A1 Lamole]|eukprot:KDE05486.1 cysteinyl-tRNA synthetase [Microbotryum lychnidis-dioicae p1A1 Lamole]
MLRRVSCTSVSLISLVTASRPRSVLRSLALATRMVSTTTSTAAPKVTQDSWRLPERTYEEPVLKVYNSLTRTKVEFITQKPGVVTWYNCGPTVYDASHMGHARNYLAQDIMRRILRDYFGYEVNFVMNITDVDDKIILRARQSHLLNQYTSQHTSLTSQLVQDNQTAWTAYFYKALSPALDNPTPPSTPTFQDAQSAWSDIESKLKDPKWVQEQKVRDEKLGMHVTVLQVGLKGLNVAEAELKEGKNGKEEAERLIESTKDVLSLWLDKQFGDTVTDPAIFRDLAAYWEDSYFKSMAALHVERPTTLTRVSEYIPEIVSFVEGIVARGFAYEAGGSVWFDTAKFEGAPGDQEWRHTYAKLQPWSKGNRELLEDGEGSLTSGLGKRSASDFALWKASKPGEPAWESGWGPGRPGWHIECSVMASAVLGQGMDVHSGGVDLAFPHHDNEIAQSEAFHNCRQWVNYFLHTGHLHIAGLKMSKSLKNFITIDDALGDTFKYSARQLRFAFLLQTWNAKLDFTDAGMQEVKAFEVKLNNFFDTVNARHSEAKANSVSSDGQHHFSTPELTLLGELEQAQIDFRHAMCDSFDTPKGIQIILELVSKANVYLAKPRKEVNVSVVVSVAEWTTRMLRMFGLGEGSPVDPVSGDRIIGWGMAVVPGEEAQVDKTTLLMPYLRALSTFRDRIRKLAIEGAPVSAMLQLTDQLRDIDLVDLGVALDDQDDGQALVKLVDPSTLREARDAKLAIQAEKEAKKAATLAAAERKRREKLEKGRVDPKVMFRTEEYSEWDKQGLPAKDKEGIELPKSRRKKLQKEWDAQNKLHEEF